MTDDDKGKAESEGRVFVRSVQPHDLLPDGEVIEYLRKHRGEPDYLTQAIRLRVEKIGRSKHSLDVNVGAPMPPPPNILKLEGPQPYMVCQAKQHYEEGISWIRANNYEKAIECLKFAAAARPNDDLIQLDLGSALFAVGRYEEGIPHLEKAAEINAYTSAPYETLAVAHAEKGDDASAIEILLGAPTSAPMLTTIAQILAKDGKHPDVEKEVLDLALELAPDYYLTHGLLARLFSRLDQIDEAIKAAEQALQLKPSDADAAVVLADLKYRSGALEESRHYLLTAQRSRPLDTTLRRVLDQLEAELANPGEPDSTVADPAKVKVSRALPKGSELEFLQSDTPGHVSVRLRLPAQKEPSLFTDLPVKSGVVALPITIVFLCHSRQDRSEVEKIADQLQSIGFCVWIDKKDILPGDAWEDVIEDAIETADFVLVSLSERALEQKGYYWREIRYALQQRDRRPEGERYIMPVMIEKVEIPRSFSGIHCEDLTQPGWLERLALAMSPAPEGR
jgi:tetratricopeptide (TPR) repeat protein